MTKDENTCDRCGGFMIYDSDNIYRFESLICIICGYVKDISNEEKHDNISTDD